ncbi:MAG: hypothetical protein IJK02_12420 [Clostridia bacterium]|nr:hypothetical protein [Clostridia bacterium]
MEQFILDQIRYGLKFIPLNIGKSFFVRRSNAETKALRQRGFICGVCHPNENYSQIREANIGWVRFDIPFPFEKDDSLSEHYLSFKERCRGYAENGIKVMAVTPYPREYVDYGIDFETTAGKEKVCDVARFLVQDLKGLVGGLQVTNEMGLPHFTLPFTMEQAVEFIGIQLQAMYPIRGDILIGYNSGGPGADLHVPMLKYKDWTDYIGIDIYIGCFANVGGLMSMFEALLRYLWALTGKPILLQEFGYISDGKPKNTKGKNRLLQERYRMKNEKEAKENIETFVDRLPESLRKHTQLVTKNDPSRYYDLLFRSDLRNHVYTEMPSVTKIPGFEHTPEGQAKFYDVLLNKLYDLDFVCGAFIYCYADSHHCYICGQSDCPIETRWGLVTAAGEPKPSYYAVRKVFGRFRWLDNTAQRKARSEKEGKDR